MMPHGLRTSIVTALGLVLLAFAACSDEEAPVAPIDVGATGGGSSGSAPLCTPGAVESCYAGPESTRDVGQCKSGTRTCLPSGLAFSVCSGEVLPQPENCLTPEDEACDGLSSECSAFAVSWAQSYGLSGSTVIRDVAIDKAQGDLIVVGDFTGSASFGGAKLQSSGGKDLFVARITELGELVWVKPFGDAFEQTASSVVVHDEGRIFVGGKASGTVDLGLGAMPTQGGSDALLFCLDAQGNTLWGKLYGELYDQSITALALTNTGHIAVAGNFSGNLGLGGPALSSPNGQDMFVGLVDVDGVHILSRRVGGPSLDLAIDLAADAEGSLLLVGSFASNLNIGVNVPTVFSTGARDAFVAKLSADGTALWLNRYGGLQGERVFAVTADGSSRVFIAGDAESAVTIAESTLTPEPNARGLFVASLDKDGSELWSLMHTSPKSTSFSASLAIDPTTHDLLVGGYFDDSFELGSGQAPSLGGTDIFLARLSGQGAYISSRTFGGPKNEGALSLAVTAKGLPILAGAYEGPLDFGKGVLPVASPNEANAFVARLWP